MVDDKASRARTSRKQLLDCRTSTISQSMLMSNVFEEGERPSKRPKNYYWYSERAIHRCFRSSQSFSREIGLQMYTGR